MKLEETLSNILVVSKVRNKILGFQFEENKLSRIYNLENKSLVGNIYVGYVKDIVKNLNAAFVEIDGESKGFLSLKNYPYKIKQGDKILVQVAGDKVKTKDYLLTWKLNISVGTVKWHLSDIRSGLKEKIDMVKNSNLSVNPIYFINMGHSGSPGKNGDTKDMFDSRLKQNIAWSCYYQAKTITDISKELEVPIAYIEGELRKLVEWGYIADGENQVTVINVKDGNLVTVINNFVANHIQIPKFIFEEGKKVDERLYEVNKSKYPEHLEKLVRYNNSNAFTWGEFIPYIVERMLEVGMLKPLTQKQKKAVFTVVAIDC